MSVILILENLMKNKKLKSLKNKNFILRMTTETYAPPGWKPIFNDEKHRLSERAEKIVETCKYRLIELNGCERKTAFLLACLGASTIVGWSQAEILAQVDMLVSLNNQEAIYKLQNIMIENINSRESDEN